MCGIFFLSRCHFLTPVYFAVREESSSLCPNTFPTSYQLTQSIGQDREKYNFTISWRLVCPSNQTPNPESTKSEFISLNPKFAVCFDLSKHIFLRFKTSQKYILTYFNELFFMKFWGWLLFCPKKAKSYLLECLELHWTPCKNQSFFWDVKIWIL